MGKETVAAATSVAAPTAGDPGARRRLVRALQALAAVAGVVGFAAHLNQTSDPTPTVAYYSPDVALALGVVSGLALVTWRSPRVSAVIAWGADAFTAGILFASAVYWFALVPVNGLPAASDPAAVVAAIAIHLALPAVAIPAYLLSDGSMTTTRARRVSEVFPIVIYGAIVAAVYSVLGRPYPYEFVDPGVVGGWLAVVFAVLTIIVYGALCLALASSRDRFQRSR